MVALTDHSQAGHLAPHFSYPASSFTLSCFGLQPLAVGEFLKGLGKLDPGVMNLVQFR